MGRGARLCFEDTETLVVPNPTCAAAASHTPDPRDYVGFFTWAREMARTHVQRRCPMCQLFVIWIPKVTCSACGRAFAPIGDGTPRSHKLVDGSRCPGAHQPAKLAEPN
jgi:hypothetical protein